MEHSHQQSSQPDAIRPAHPNQAGASSGRRWKRLALATAWVARSLDSTTPHPAKYLTAFGGLRCCKAFGLLWLGGSAMPSSEEQAAPSQPGRDPSGNSLLMPGRPRGRTSKGDGFVGQLLVRHVPCAAGVGMGAVCARTVGRRARGSSSGSSWAADKPPARCATSTPLEPHHLLLGSRMGKKPPLFSRQPR